MWGSDLPGAPSDLQGRPRARGGVWVPGGDRNGLASCWKLPRVACGLDVPLVLRYQVSLEFNDSVWDFPKQCFPPIVIFV